MSTYEVVGGFQERYLSTTSYWHTSFFIENNADKFADIFVKFAERSPRVNIRFTF